MVENCYKCLNCYFKEMKIWLYSSLISKRIIEKIKVEITPVVETDDDDDKKTNKSNDD